MHFARTTFIILVTLPLSLAGPSEEPGDVDAFFPLEPHRAQSLNVPPSPPSGLPEAFDRHPHLVQERAITFGWYSHFYNRDNLWQWTFGNASNAFNISVSTCVNGTDVAGVYQFEDGTTRDDTTVGDVIRDIQSGDTPASPERYTARTLSNILAAYDDAQTFLLDMVFCSGPSLYKDELRRHLLARPDYNRRVRVVVYQSVVGLLVTLVGTGITLASDQPSV